MPRPGIDQ